jgi:hypothetical protein
MNARPILTVKRAAPVPALALERYDVAIERELADPAFGCTGRLWRIEINGDEIGRAPTADAGITHLSRCLAAYGVEHAFKKASRLFDTAKIEGKTTATFTGPGAWGQQ